jgi:hypothetical protein
VNGGELLFAALATCFCNDATVSYRVQVHANAPQSTIDDLIRATDSVTEIQNTTVLAARFGWSRHESGR